MAGDEHKREKLVALLDRKVFDPILSTSYTDYTTVEQREEFLDLRQTTEHEKQRFHEEYISAEAVKNGYFSDVYSSDAVRQSAEAEDLELPTMADVQEEFRQLCEELHI